jgi:hypothetical protein
MLYQDSQNILADVEAHMIGFSERETPWVRSLWRETGGLIKFIIHGLRESLRQVRKYYLWQLIVMIICTATWSLLSEGIRHIIEMPLALFIIIAPLFFTILSAPSTYAHGGVSDQDVEYARSAICRMKINTEAALKAHKANIEFLEKPVSKRVKLLRATPSVFWSVWVYWLWSLFVPQSTSSLGSV